MDKTGFFEEAHYYNPESYTQDVIEQNLSQTEILDKDILDFGCGIGDAALYFCENHRPKSVVAVDLGRKNIEIGKQRTLRKAFSNINFVIADLNKYPLPEQTYDLIWSDTVIELLDDTEKVIQSYHETLRSGGVLYLSFSTRCMFNLLLYKFIVPTLKLVPGFARPFLCKVIYLFLAPSYHLQSFKDPDFHFKPADVKSKIAGLFMPAIKLLRNEIVKSMLEDAGFKIEYMRPRLLSDINGTPHTEIKAFKS